jgi:curli biogenesis system outer membrane secretion channel CsgG
MRTTTPLRILSAAIVVGLLGSAIAQERPSLKPYTGPKKRIAVMKIDASSVSRSRYSDLANIYKSERGVRTQDDLESRLTEMLTTALDSTGRFILLERANLDDIREEIAIGKELGNEKTAVQKGNVLGAQMLIRAAVTEFEPRKKEGSGGVSIGGVNVGGSQGEASVILDIRFIDPNTSQVLYTAKAEGTSKSSGLAGGIRIGNVSLGGGQADRQPIDRAVSNAVEKAVFAVVDKLEALPWEARVAKVNEDGTFILNRGSNDGVREGDRLAVYAPGEVITDPETGEVLGREEDKLIGEARVTWVSDKLAKATYTGPNKLATSDVLRMVRG